MSTQFEDPASYEQLTGGFPMPGNNQLKKCPWCAGPAGYHRFGHTGESCPYCQGTGKLDHTKCKPGVWGRFCIHKDDNCPKNIPDYYQGESDQPSAPADEVGAIGTIIIETHEAHCDFGDSCTWSFPEIAKAEALLARCNQQAVVAALEKLKHDIGDDPIWVYKIMRTLDAAIARAKAGGK